MITVATGDAGVALQINQALAEKKAFITAARDHINFRHQVHQQQPLVLILDARVGGETFEVLQGLPLVSSNVKSKPLTIVLLPKDSLEGWRQAVELGAYEVVSLSDPRWLETTTSAVVDAFADRDRGVRPLLSERLSATLH